MASSTHPLQEGSFDPLETLRRSGADASDPRGVRLRMLWLRKREPSASITTALVTLDERVVVLSAAVRLPDGGEGSGHAATRIDDATDLAEAIETAELRAIGKALDALGYVVVDRGSTSDKRAEPERVPAQPALDAAEPAQPRESVRPVADSQPEGSNRQPPEHVRALRAIREREQRAPQQPAQDIPPIGSTNQPESDPEVPSPAPTERTRPRPIRPATPAPTDDDGEPALEDVSWTAFWEWARETYQLRSRVQLEEVLGQPVGNKPPGELRRLLIAHFDEAGPGES